MTDKAKNTGSADNKDNRNENPDYYFGGIREFNIDQIETEIFSESIYLDVFAGSDMRLKKEIQPIAGALDKLTRLDGVTFKWNAETAPAHLSPDNAIHAGLIAQNVASEIPELVRADTKSGMLAVDYAKLTAYLIEAVKELNQRVSDLEKNQGSH